MEFENLGFWYSKSHIKRTGVRDNRAPQPEIHQKPKKIHKHNIKTGLGQAAGGRDLFLYGFC